MLYSCCVKNQFARMFRKRTTPTTFVSLFGPSTQNYLLYAFHLDSFTPHILDCWNSIWVVLARFVVISASNLHIYHQSIDFCLMQHYTCSKYGCVLLDCVCVMWDMGKWEWVCVTLLAFTSLQIIFPNCKSLFIMW